MATSLGAQRNTMALVVCAAALAGMAALWLVSSKAFGQPKAPTSVVSTPSKPGGPAWASLSAAQKLTLAPLQREWADIDANGKAKWLEVASRFSSMPPSERERVQQRMAAWSHLTPAERGQARLQFQQARQLSPVDRQARWDEYTSLPEEARRELAQRAKPVTTAAQLQSAQPGAFKAASGSNKVDLGKAVPLAEKRNVVRGSDHGVAKSVSPTVVQVKPGATTNLVTRAAPPPNHQQPGLPKIVATEGFVNPSTLLPKRGAQGAAVRTTAAASGPAASP